MTVNQLRQALRPYTCHWVFWAVIAIWFVMHAPLPSASQQDLPDFVWMSLMANMALGTGIGAMLKTQFANPRARLMPGFRAAHLVATCGFVCAVLAVEAALAPAWGNGAPRLAMLSVAALAMAASTWFAYSMISALWLLVAPIVLAPAIAPQLLARSTQALISSPLLSLGLIAVGLMALAALGTRLWVLSEESPEYSWQIPSGDITPRPDNRNLRKLEAQMVTRSRSLMWRLDLQFDLVVRNVRSMSPLRRVLFRQVATGFSGLSSALVITALFAGHGFWSPLNLAVASIATALAAVLLYRLAFRRWCHIDLA